MRIEEINARVKEIESSFESVEGEELRSLNEELDSLIAERKAIEEEEQTRAKMREDIARGNVETTIIEKKEEETKMEERTFGIESVEYRNAWLKTLQGALLNEVEARAYASTDNHNAIPTLVADKMFAEMKKTAPMLSEITLLRVAGNVKFVATGTRNDASKHTENQNVNASADTIVSVTLGAFEFMKVIGISKTAANQSVDSFEAWLVSLLAEDIARAIDNYIINDASNGLAAITYTTNTNQIVQAATTGYTYKDIVALIGLLPASYDAEAKFLVNKKTLYGKIATIVDSSNRPIFVANAEDGMHGRIMGYPVLVDDYVSTSNGALYLGKYSDIVGNLSEGVNVERDESSGFTSGTINYRGFAAFDSKPAKTDSFVRLVTTA